jgi:probable addiction module antidote protein
MSNTTEHEYNPTAEELLERFPNLKPWEPGEWIETPKDAEAAIAFGLEVAIEEGDSSFLNKILASVLRKQNISQLAKDTGLSRQTLYTISTTQSDPRFSTLASVLKALGYGLSLHKLSDHRPVEHA